LSISYNYLLAIIYKLVIICKGCYNTVTTPTNKDLQLLLHSISTRFYLTLFTDSFLPNSRTYLSVRVLCFVDPPSCPLNKGNSQSDVRDRRAYFGNIHLDVGQLQILVSTFGAHCGAAVKLTTRPLFSPKVSTRSDLRCETPFKGSNPPPTIMPDTNTLQQLQTQIMEMEQRHEEELRKLNADHDQQEAHMKHP